ncbi:M56 family metallopeptidase [Maledivibacter halophilus]|uniref:Bla regulator protein blaR1 n=1 Tax=Maledivibacter halophilus TaxID=36842 RepID=A0A1T5IT22_9FIRM|nr:M56 family metallopeptidase [Maledivibacter halophilus]SKC42337.1 bla regulator protein blaR1 [Maledivibacter halophilus]
MNYSEVFYWLIDTSIKGSLLIISILLIKLLLKNRLGARWHYSIWFLLLIRLVMPFAPQSSISVFNLFIHKNIITEKYSPNQIIGWFNTEITDPNLLHNNSSTAFEEPLTRYISLFMESSIHFKLVLIWFIVVISLSIFTIIVNVKFALNIKGNSFSVNDYINGILEDCKEKMGIGINIPIIQTSYVKAPALYGFIHPKLLLPVNIESQVNKNELQYIIFHELSHLKRKDIMVFWIMTFLKIIYWFNPIILYGFYQMRQDCEISCDALALSYIDYNDSKKYGKTIIRLLENNAKPLNHFMTAGLLSSKSQLKRRIRMIALFKKNAYKLSLVSIAILILMGGMFLTNAKEKTTEVNNTPQENNQIEIEEINNTQDNITEEETIKKMIWPLPDSTKIVSPFGWRVHPVLKTKKLHTGTDIAGKEGLSIVAAVDGVVIHSDVEGGYGKAIIIDHGDGVATLYAHCSELLVKKGQKVKAGDEIAKVGSSGLATQAHLHFEIRKDDEPVDPFKGYIDSKYDNK